MGSSFTPVGKERAEELKQALKRARSSGQGLAFDKNTGNCLGASSLRNAPSDKVNMIGKFDTHYGRRA